MVLTSDFKATLRRLSCMSRVCIRFCNGEAAALGRLDGPGMTQQQKTNDEAAPKAPAPR